MRITEKLLRNMVRETISEMLSNTKTDLKSLFNLKDIPEDELKRQHYDISLHSHSYRFCSVLNKNQGGTYLKENDERVTPAAEAVNEIVRKYMLRTWQVNVVERGHDIQVCVCIANYKNAINEIIQDFNHMGYFLAQNEKETDAFGQQWQHMQFDPLYQRNETEEILKYGNLRHLTPSYNVSNILKNGLTPKSDNDRFSYPNRIFFFIGKTHDMVIDEFGKELSQSNTDPRNNGEYTLLEIQCDELKDNIDLYYDPNFLYGVFCETPIPPEYIKVVDNYKFDTQPNQ